MDSFFGTSWYGPTYWGPSYWGTSQVSPFGDDTSYVTRVVTPDLTFVLSDGVTRVVTPDLTYIN